jgi:carbamoyltransferase
MIIWGITANNHDASIAVFEYKVAGLTNNKKLKLLWAGLTRDFSDVPNDPDLNRRIIEFLKNQFGTPTEIVFYEKPILKSLRQLWAGQGFKFGENNIKNYLKKYGLNVPIKYTKHHESHAAYGYYTSGLKNAVIIVLDSIGEFETISIWSGLGNKIQKRYSQSYPHSVGLFYSAMAQRCGFQANAEENKLEQLAKQGDWKVLYDAFNQELIKNRMPFETHINLHRGCRWWRPELNSENDIANIAATTQKIFEEVILEHCSWARMFVQSRNLILVGGCALNRTATDKIKNLWNSFWVPKNPGDPGSCVGAVLARYEKHIDFNEKLWYNKSWKF